MNRALYWILVVYFAIGTVGCLPENNCAVTATCEPDPVEAEAGQDSSSVGSRNEASGYTGVSSDASAPSNARSDGNAFSDTSDDLGPRVIDGGTTCTGGFGAGCASETDGGPGRPSAASLVIDPDTKDFSSVVTGFFVEAAFQISNAGELPTSVPAVNLDGTDSAAFSISSSTCTAVLAPDGACVVIVRFSPTTPE